MSQLRFSIPRVLRFVRPDNLRACKIGLGLLTACVIIAALLLPDSAPRALAGPDPDCTTDQDCPCGTCVGGHCWPCDDGDPCTQDVCGDPGCGTPINLPDCDSDGVCDEQDIDDDNDGIEDCLGPGPCANPCTGGEVEGCTDNCPCDINPLQEDANANGVGDKCDDDKVLRVDVDSTAQNPDGSTWPEAFPNLQDALLAAYNGTANSYEIWVAEGVYRPDVGTSQNPNDRASSFLLVANVPVYGGFFGDEDVRSQHDHRQYTTELTGVLTDGTTRAYHVVKANESSVGATLDGFVITGGSADAQTGPANKVGGGLSIRDADPVISNCVFKQNTAKQGGALHSRALGLATGPQIVNCEFIENHATERGGAVNNYFGTRTDLVNCVFAHNTADQHGGAFHSWTSTDGDASIINCTFVDNSATGLGGAVYSDIAAANTSGLRIGNTILWGNDDSSTNGSSSEIYEADGAVTLSYSDIEGGWPGTGNINADPLFYDTGCSAIWVAANSPVIGAGDLNALPQDTADLDRDGDRAETLPLDLLDAARTSGGTVDIGPIQVLTHVLDPALDCNTNGAPDTCELAEGLVSDCNSNALPDDCEIQAGSSRDDNCNGVPDECDFEVYEELGVEFVLRVVTDCEASTAAVSDTTGGSVPVYIQGALVGAGRQSDGLATWRSDLLNLGSTTTTFNLCNSSGLSLIRPPDLKAFDLNDGVANFPAPDPLNPDQQTGYVGTCMDDGLSLCQLGGGQNLLGTNGARSFSNGPITGNFATGGDFVDLATGVIHVPILPGGSTIVLTADNVFAATFDDVSTTGPLLHTTPASVQVIGSLAIVAGGDALSPGVKTVASKVTHVGTDFGILTSSNSFESRTGGPQQLVVTFSENVFPEDGILTDNNDVSLSSGTVVSQSIFRDQLTIEVSSIPDQTCVTVSFPGLEDAFGNSSIASFQLRVLEGDVNGDGVVNSMDEDALNLLLNKKTDSVNARYDIDQDGIVNGDDLAIVQARDGNSVTCP